MRNLLKYIFPSAVLLLTLVSCSEKEDVPDNNGNQGTEYDDAYYASQATVTSSDTNFTANSDGGTIHFKTEGGSVTLNVSCGCDWLVENDSSDLFATASTSTSLTVTAEQNTVEQELNGTITLKTASQRIVFSTITITQNAYGVPEISVETNEWKFPAVGALTAEIAVDASTDWTVEADESWLTAVKSMESVILVAATNKETAERSCTVTLTCNDGIKTSYEYISVSQDGAAYITLSNEGPSFAGKESSTSVTVQSNYEWEYSSSDDWLTVSRNGDVLTLSVTTNEGDDRSGTVTITAGDGAENATEAVITAFQAGIADMVLTYTITSENMKITLPLMGTVNCTVNWGDGVTENVSSTLPSHTYAFTGEYKVIIRGAVTSLNSSTLNSSSSKNTTLTTVEQWGSTGLTSMDYAFYHCSNLASLPETTGDAFANVTSFERMFYSCASFEEIPSDIFANCPKVTSFNHVFYMCSSIKEIPKGLFDNCPLVTDFSYAFYYCNTVTEIPAGLFDNCPLATGFECVFYYCNNVKEIPAGLFDKCTNITSIAGAFYYSGVTKIPVGLFDNCSGVTDFTNLFYYCESLEEIPKGLFDKCTSATSFYFAFASCHALTEIPEGLFDNCPEMTNFSCAFYGCRSLKEIPAKIFAKCTKVENFLQTFALCSAITEVPEGLFDNCPNVTNFQNIFRSCTALVSVPPSIFSKNLKVENFSYAFYGDTALTGESPYDTINGEKVHLYERADHPDIYTAPTSYGNCFTSCTGLTDYSSIPSSWL